MEGLSQGRSTRLPISYSGIHGIISHECRFYLWGEAFAARQPLALGKNQELKLSAAILSTKCFLPPVAVDQLC
jgi:hypothetical protein